MAPSSTIPNSEWQKHEATIRDLYIAKNKTLSVVKHEMSSVHGFHASQYQYTTKLKEWKLQKNSKRDIWQSISGALKRRHMSVSEADVYLNDSRVAPKRLKKELARYTAAAGPSADGDIHAPPTPEGVIIQPILDHIHQTAYSIPRSIHISLLWRNLIDFRILTCISPTFYPATLPVASSVQMYASDWNLAGLQQDDVPFFHGMFSPLSLDLVEPLLSTAMDLRKWNVENKDTLSTTSFQNEVMKFFGIEKLGETRSAVQELMNPRSTTSMQILISYMTLLFSNDLILDEAVQAFLARAEEMQQLGDFRPLFVQQSPSARAVATCLLHAAIQANAISFLSQALKYTDVESPSTGEHSLSLLQEALRRDKYEAAQILITAGADVNTGVEARCSGVCCRYYGHYRNGFTGECQIIGAYCPIALAARSRACVNLIPELVGKGGVIPECSPVLFHAIRNGASVDIVSCLIDAGAHVDRCLLTRWEGEATPLSAAARRNNLQILQLLLDKGADPNSFMRSDTSQSLSPSSEMYAGFAPPLVSALEGAHGDNTCDIVRLLLQSGANPNISSLEIMLKAFPVLSPREALQPFESRSRMSARYGSGKALILYPLQAAAELGKIELVELLLRYKASLNTTYGTPALTVAVMRSNTDIVRLLVRHHADPDGYGAHDFCQSPLEAAVEKEDLDLIDLLLKAGADINRLSASCGGRTPLQRAAENGNERVIQHLLQHGASMLSPPAPTRGASALCGFVRNQLHRYVSEALKAGANPNADPSYSGLSPIVEAVVNNDTVSLDLLLHEDANVDEHHYSNHPDCHDDQDILYFFPEMSPLQWAAYMNHLEVAAILCDAGADVNQLPFDSAGDSALYLAVRLQNYDMADLLIARGAEIDMHSERETALCIAIEKSSPSLVQLLLDSDSDPNQPSLFPEEDDEGLFTPLEAACYVGNISVIEALLHGGADASQGNPIGRLLSDPNGMVDTSCSDELQELREKLERLLQHGADVNGRVYDQDTALQTAIREKFFDCAYRLIEVGACINAAASDAQHGRTALQAAAEMGDVDLVELLLSRGADVNAPAAPDHGVTALQAAAINGYLRIAQILLEHHADIDAEASVENGRTAIDGAAEFGRIDMVKLLLDNYHGAKPIFHVRDSAYRAAKKGNQWHVMELLNTYEHPDKIWP